MVDVIQTESLISLLGNFQFSILGGLILAVYFISGHLDITEEEFQKHYEPILWDKINDPNNSFVVGDADGCDTMAQKYLKAMGVKEVKVYHMYDEPRNNSGFNLMGGFISDNDRDSAMTYDSDFDIAWVKEGRENSGTAKNLERRKKKNRRNN